MIKNYIKTQRLVIILIPILVFISYGYIVFSGNVGIDTEYIITNPGTTFGWEHIGRFGGVFLANFFHLNYYNLPYIGTFFVIFYILSIELLLFFTWLISKGDKSLPLWIMTILISTTQIYMFLFYFTMMIGMIGVGFFVVTIGAFVCVILIFGDYKAYTIPFLILDLVPIILAFGIYQAFVPYFITLCGWFSLLFVTYRYNEGQGKKAAVRLFLLALYFIVAYVIYSKIANLYMSSDYLSQQLMWKEGIGTCIKNIILGVGKEVLGVRASRFSIYFIDCILLLYIAIKSIKKNEKPSDIAIIRGTVIVCTMLTPFMLTVYLGTETYIRTLFSLPFVAAGMAMYLYPRVDFSYFKHICVIVCAMQLLMCTQLSYTDHVRYKNDYANALELSNLIKESGVDELKPIVYMGKKEAKLNKLCNRIDVFGESLWEHDYEDESFGGVTTRIYGFLNSCQIYTRFSFPFTDSFYEHREQFKRELTSFPDKGCIVERSNYIVIKLSD